MQSLQGLDRPPRVLLSGISPVAWEHPTDRATLQALRAVPGFDDLLRKLVGFFDERGMRLLFQANAVRVGPRQLPKLHAAYQDVLATLDCPEAPELYVSQAPFVNAGAYGMERPFIVVNSAALELLDDDELRSVLGHEVGHVMSGHALYHTLLVLVLEVGFGFLPSVASIAVGPVRLALLEWYRMSEISCDRAALLASQAPEAALRVFLKLAGGRSSDETSLDAFLMQAREYRGNSGAIDRIFKILNVLGRHHPFATLRAAALVDWIEGGHYDRILRGEYPKRGATEAERPKGFGVADVRDHYAKEARAAVGDVVGSVVEAAQAIRSSLTGPRE